ncbi:MAG: hypothetical protein KatS3mg093_287 [Candidatus Parcubacteria bacterium]|nr:MAG: hypothetical protein KatS3mg093_287 [Candidatus Parcubacteria bacterium]
MAIVVEEEKQNNANILYILIWGVLILAILIGVYYVFFKKPELYESTLSLNKTETNINEVINAKSYVDLNIVLKMTESLKNYIDIPQNISTGKENPFSF